MLKGQTVQGTIEGKHAHILEAEITTVYGASAKFDYEILIDRVQTGNQANTRIKVMENEIEALGDCSITYEGKAEDIAFLMGM